MRKSFKLQDLECANCAAKMENDIADMPEVNSANISFMTSRMTLDIADDASMDNVLDSAQKIISSYEKDCTIVI